MSHDSATRSSDAKAIMLMIAVLAGAVGLIGFVLDHLAINPSQMHPIATAHAASSSSTPKKVVAVAEKVEEVWAADESARGTRPEASH